jgi:hypothetical protein
MANLITFKAVDNIYLKMELWKCDISPSGAHHWVELSYNSSKFKCKYCGLSRRFPTNYSDALSFCNPNKMANYLLSEESYLYMNKSTVKRERDHKEHR